MRATIIKVGDIQPGKNYKVPYRAISFALEDGRYAICYIAANYRNSRRWFNRLRVGQSFIGIRLLNLYAPNSKETLVIDADSPVAPDYGPPCKLAKTTTKEPDEKQIDLL